MNERGLLGFIRRHRQEHEREREQMDDVEDRLRRVEAALRARGDVA